MEVVFHSLGEGEIPQFMELNDEEDEEVDDAVREKLTRQQRKAKAQQQRNVLDQPIVTYADVVHTSTKSAKTKKAFDEMNLSRPLLRVGLRKYCTFVVYDLCWPRCLQIKYNFVTLLSSGVCSKTLHV